MPLNEFIEKAVKVHGNKYNYDKVIYVNSRTKVVINCPKPGHGDFKQTPYAHSSPLEKNGCPTCFRERLSEKLKYSMEDFLKLATEIHGNTYDYSESEYLRSGIKIKIICHKETDGIMHGEFWQTPNKHLSAKRGCPKCNGGVKHDLDTFIKKSNQIHGNKYDYSESNYINSSTKIKIICHGKDFLGNKHGEFWQLPLHHLGKHGCPKCAGHWSSTDNFINKAQLIHGNKYDYSKVVYDGSKINVEIICHNKTRGEEHGSFWQNPNNHLNDHGCPKCVTTISKLEKE